MSNWCVFCQGCLPQTILRDQLQHVVLQHGVEAATFSEWAGIAAATSVFPTVEKEDPEAWKELLHDVLAKTTAARQEAIDRVQLIQMAMSAIIPESIMSLSICGPATLGYRGPGNAVRLQIAPDANGMQAFGSAMQYLLACQEHEITISGTTVRWECSPGRVDDFLGRCVLLPPSLTSSDVQKARDDLLGRGFTTAVEVYRGQRILVFPTHVAAFKCLLSSAQQSWEWPFNGTQWGLAAVPPSLKSAEVTSNTDKYSPRATSLVQQSLPDATTHLALLVLFRWVARHDPEERVFSLYLVSLLFLHFLKACDLHLPPGHVQRPPSVLHELNPDEVNHEKTADLVTRFFSFYASFDWNVYCVNLNSRVLKPRLAELNWDPVAVRRTLSSLNVKDQCHMEISVADPYVPGNVAAAITPPKAAYFRGMFSLCHALLSRPPPSVPLNKRLLAVFGGVGAAPSDMTYTSRATKLLPLLGPNTQPLPILRNCVLDIPPQPTTSSAISGPTSCAPLVSSQPGIHISPFPSSWARGLTVQATTKSPAHTVTVGANGQSPPNGYVNSPAASSYMSTLPGSPQHTESPPTPSTPPRGLSAFPSAFPTFDDAPSSPLHPETPTSPLGLRRKGSLSSSGRFGSGLALDSLIRDLLDESPVSSPLHKTDGGRYLCFKGNAGSPITTTLPFPSF